MRPILTVDPEAIAANWRLLSRTHCAPTAAVVKADAYGLGAAIAAPHLHQAGARHFFVAQLDEAVILRPLLPGAMIAVLNGFAEAEASAYLAHNVLPVLGSLPEIDAYARLAQRANRVLPALLHVDTGMNRLGLPAGDIAHVADRARGIAWRAVMTHLVSAECREDPINAEQRARFAAACAALPGVPRSLANSSGIFLGADFRSDLARPGAALYGINPTPGRPNPMAPTMRLSAPVLQLRAIAAGEGVGYNAAWVAARPTIVATVALGYADGYHRAVGRGAPGSGAPGTGAPGTGAVSGPGGGAPGGASVGAAHPQAAFDRTRLPLIGRVSMDLTTFDATDVPGLAPGAMLELIGPAIPPDEVAAWAGTNGYEVLTSLGTRAARVVGRL
jgi:alanine racemase